MRGEVGDQVVDAVGGRVPVGRVRGDREVLGAADGGDEPPETGRSVEHLKPRKPTVLVIVGIELARIPPIGHSGIELARIPPIGHSGIGHSGIELARVGDTVAQRGASTSRRTMV